MPKRRKTCGNEGPPSGVRSNLSGLGEWERAWVRKLGLEDIDWDPEQYCEHCIAKRAARGEAVEEVAPPSDSRPKLRVSLGWAKTPPTTRSPKGWSERRGKLTLVKLVRSARRERKDS